MSRTKPNFLITGTPGVGKTTFSEMLSNQFGLIHIPISRLIEEKHLWEEFDDERNCSIYDEDKLDDAIDEILQENPDGGIIFDFHCSDIVKIEDIDYVLVLRTTSDLLFKRLEGRGYSQEKVRENTECEIFRVVLDEAIENFSELPEGHVIEIQSDTVEDLDHAMELVGELIQHFGESA